MTKKIASQEGLYPKELVKTRSNRRLFNGHIYCFGVQCFTVGSLGTAGI